ncbi:MAG: hypothetical protein V3V33_02790 [Candidatus Lokiarchaeia archaeon]
MKDNIEWDWRDDFHPDSKKKVPKKKDPKVTFKKGVMIAILLLSIGIAQLIFVISVRSKLIWRYKGGPVSGEEVINVPPTYLYPNRYIIMVIGHFPMFRDENVVGNITFIHQNSGKTYTFNYTIFGYLMHKTLIFDTRLWSMNPGKYNVLWDNNYDRYEYYFTTYALFNFFPNEDKYPTNMETIMLIVSIFGLAALLIASIKRYIGAKRDYAFYQ